MKFRIGQKLTYLRLNKVGTVAAAFDTEAGPRYYLDIAGDRWSILETELSFRLPPPPKKPQFEKLNENEEREGSGNSELP